MNVRNRDNELKYECSIPEAVHIATVMSSRYK